MSQHRVGTCSLCGGTVVGYRGVWMAIIPPPPDRCTTCRAVAASDVIPMVRPPGGIPPHYTTETTDNTWGSR